jgi:transcriptional regulator with XRE-family HTH domain
MKLLSKYFSIGNRIKQIRDKYNLSQKRFADNIGISHSFLSELEAGITKPSMPILYSIEYKYRYRWEWIMTGDGEMHVDSLNPPVMLSSVGKEVFDRSIVFWVRKLIKILETGDKDRVAAVKTMLKTLDFKEQAKKTGQYIREDERLGEDDLYKVAESKPINPTDVKEK